mmetsp:Transcript_9428/g.23921  ORF Transcript_9428/g.23921 Transcript_9428/m.23921 type:complete len:209 (+) Transcript_9428:2421-3047(+)
MSTTRSPPAPPATALPRPRSTPSTCASPSAAQGASTSATTACATAQASTAPSIPRATTRPCACRLSTVSRRALLPRDARGSTCTWGPSPGAISRVRGARTTHWRRTSSTITTCAGMVRLVRSSRTSGTVLELCRSRRGCCPPSTLWSPTQSSPWKWWAPTSTGRGTASCSLTARAPAAPPPPPGRRTSTSASRASSPRWGKWSQPTAS